MSNDTPLFARFSEKQPRGEVIGQAKYVARNTSGLHEVLAWLQDKTIPYFKGDFNAAVNAIAGSLEKPGPTLQTGGLGITLKTQIDRIGKEIPVMASALRVIAVNRFNEALALEPEENVEFSPRAIDPVALRLESAKELSALLDGRTYPFPKPKA